jgi:hypothetical protein
MSTKYPKKILKKHLRSLNEILFLLLIKTPIIIIKIAYSLSGGLDFGKKIIQRIIY